MTLTWRILTGDVRETLKSLPDGCVQTCVTSPPYWGLRCYGHDAQLGLEPTPGAYVANLVAVFSEVRRVLSDDGTVFLNLGDSYMSSGPRQTGRNDADRETPGGRGGSFRGGVRRVVACDTSDKEPASFQARDCLCGSLCDACRKAYQIGRSHSGVEHNPTPAPSPCATSHGRTESLLGHLPTSDSGLLAGRSGDASRRPVLTDYRAGEPPVASLESKSIGCVQPLQETHSVASIQGEGCRLCGRSLGDCVPASAGTTACTCGTEKPSGASMLGMLGTASEGLAYLYFTTAFLKPKDLCGIPWRVAFALQADGWYLRSDIIWSKPNPMPESVTDRPTKAHEYIFLLTKSARYFYDADAIREAYPSQSEDAYRNRQLTAKRMHNLNTDRKMKLDGVTGAVVIQGGRDSQFVNPPHPSGRNKRSVWHVATQPYAGAHFATFPEALIEPCILAGSRLGDTVLDPFCGSGTTGAVAIRNGRNFIGCELNEEYVKLAEKRIGAVAPLFAERTA